jgi:eukaryotic-like serine/threonine-protein kinase
VYRARDTKLKREVAIKILPDEFSRDAERVSRFQREAEVLASLDYVSYCTPVNEVC